MKKSFFNLLLRALISFFFIGLLLWLMRGNFPGIVSAIKNANLTFLLIGFIVHISAAGIIAFRMLKVISVQQIRLTYNEAAYLTFIGYFFNNFLPTSIGGDVVKAYYAGKKSGKKTAAFAGIFMDRFLAMIPFSLIPAVTLCFYNNKLGNRALAAVVYVLFFTFLFLAWLLFNKNMARYIQRLLRPFKNTPWHERILKGYNFLNIYSRHRLILLWSFVLSVATQALWILSAYFYARSVGVADVSLSIFFIVVPIVGIMSMLPSLNGLGIRESGFVYLLKPYMSAEKAFAVSILSLAALVGFSIIGGIIYALKRRSFSFKMEG